MNSSVRYGYSLLEVILATAILLGSVVVLGELASIGRKHVISAEKRAAAQLQCETKLNEILAGLVPLESVAETPLVETDFYSQAEIDDETRANSQILDSETSQTEKLDTSSPWLYSVDVLPLEVAGMVALKVSVTEDLENIENKRPVRFSIVRWVRDPEFQHTDSIGGMHDSRKFAAGSQP